MTDRALTYLADRRLTVVRAEQGHHLAVIAGTDATHVTAATPHGTVRTCPAWRPCVHAAALELITGHADLPDLAARCPCCLPGPHPPVWPHRRDHRAAHYRCPRTGHPYTDPTRRLP